MEPTNKKIVLGVIGITAGIFLIKDKKTANILPRHIEHIVGFAGLIVGSYGIITGLKKKYDDYKFVHQNDGKKEVIMPGMEKYK